MAVGELFVAAMTHECLATLGGALERWYGCSARPWSYTPSFNRLQILLQRKDFFCAVFVLSCCERVAFAADWDGFKPSLDEGIGRSPLYHVTDGENLDVHCWAVALSVTMRSDEEVGNLRPGDFPFGEL